jgi:hypothetical protein
LCFNGGRFFTSCAIISFLRRTPVHEVSLVNLAMTVSIVLLSLPHNYWREQSHCLVIKGKKVKISPWEAEKAHKVVRRRYSHIFYLVSSQMAVGLSALCAGHSLPPGRFLALISVRGCVEPRAIMRVEGLGQLKNSVNPQGIEPATSTRSVVPPLISH